MGDDYMATCQVSSSAADESATFSKPTLSKARGVDCHEQLGGRWVSDPYRWMEDDSPELRTWIRAQHEYTMAQLSISSSSGKNPTAFGRVAACTFHWSYHQSRNTILLSSAFAEPGNLSALL